MSGVVSGRGRRRPQGAVGELDIDVQNCFIVGEFDIDVLNCFIICI